MRIGVDVGGTHTDAVLVGKEGIASSTKVVTDHEDLLNSVLSALRGVLGNVDSKRIKAITLSTTLTTNALLEGKTDRVGVIVSSGPGVDPAHHRIGDAYFVIDGSIDHRGEERKALNRLQLEEAVASCRDQGIRAYAVATKFSTRTPEHELIMESSIDRDDADVISAGHRLSGALNFPRRITTTYYNSAVWRRYNEFAVAVAASISGLGLNAPIYVLKADGGTMSLPASLTTPVQSIFSGPAASIMGIVALCEIDCDTVVLDIGGTSTDIAIFAAGVPLIEPEGISLHGRPTLVRSLKTSSIAIGGDSILRISSGKVTVGPDRSGPCMAAGGTSPALLDALNVSGDTAFGDIDASHRGISELALKAGSSAGTIATEAIDTAVQAIKAAAWSMIEEINERPVYTVHELLHADRIVPSRLFIIGAPAKAFSGSLSRVFGLETVVPKLHEVANAIGAAITRTTMDIELFADTEREVLLIPRLSVQKSIDRSYTLEDAVLDSEQYLLASVELADAAEVQVIEASSFNMVQGARMVGRNIRVRSQIKPGLIPDYLDGVRLS
ncbi:MAG: hydantoinase/oxoprolinase family protein [Dissulfurispiraceae bacterium]